MADSSAPRVSPLRPFDVDTVALLEALAGDQTEPVVQLIRERDNLFLLHHALLDAESAPTLEAQLRVLVGAIRRIGFGRVVVAVRDEALDPTLVVTGGFTSEEDRAVRGGVGSGERWRRRLEAMEPFRIGQSAYYLDGRDPWVAQEFRGASASALPQGDDPEWSPRDLLVVPLRGADGRIIATLTLDEAEDRRRPTMTRVRTVELFGQQVAQCVERARLVALAERRAERLQRLQEVGSALARTLDEREIVRELARQVGRVLPSEVLVVTHPDLEAGRTHTALRVVNGVEVPTGVGAAPLGDGPLAEVARTGRSLRLGDFDPNDVPLARGGDALGVGAGSVLAVPMLIGLQLVGVIALHASRRDAFGPEEEEVLRAIGANAATALVNARLYAESQRERRQIEALADVARAVGESLRLDEVLHLILRHATTLLRAEGGCISFRKDDHLKIVATVGSGAALDGAQFPVASSLSGGAVRTGRFVITNDAASEPALHRPSGAGPNVSRLIIVPLSTKQGAIGALSVFNRPADFTEADARVLQRLADHVAVAIENARLFEEAAAATREWTVAFDAIASGMVVLDAGGRVVRSNARAASILGRSGHAAALEGRDFAATLLGTTEGASEESRIEAVARALGGGANGALPATGRGTVHSAARGRVFDVVASPHPSGGAVVAFDDVTEHHALAERYRRVVETASDAIVITGLDRRIAFANPAALELFGATSDVVGLPVSDLVPPEAFDEVKHREDLALAGEPQRYEAVLLRLDGERRAVAISTAPLREPGAVVGIVASLRDVTEERRARDAVAHSEARYRNLFETASDAIYTLDAGASFTSMNEATGVLLGLPREEVLGRSVTPFIDPADMERVAGFFRDARAGEARRYECVVRRPDGERRQVSVTNTPIRRGSSVVGVLGIARDVTVERAREAALARSEARYTRLVESASDAIFTLDPDGSFTSVNRALELSTGQTRGALLGTPWTVLCDARDRDAMSQLFTATLGGMRQRGELRYTSVDGEERWGSIITAPIIEDDDVVSGVLAVVRDVTDEKRLMGQLLQQEKLAAIGQLVSGVAHELNNPLAGVMAFSQILLASPGVAGEERSAAETIHQEARRAAKIVSNLLTFARRHHPERTETDVNRVLLDTLELRRYALRVEQIEIEVSLDENVPTTWADPFQLQQVLLNLIGNAEHALDGWSGARRIALRTSWKGEGEPIVIAVSDSGPGVAPDQVARIFNPFYTTKPVGQGTGLGLSISDGIVRQHGGRIRVDSRLGEGATFCVELPRIEPPEVTAAPSGSGGTTRGAR